MWGDISFWNVQGQMLHSGDTLVQFILTVDYTFKELYFLECKPICMYQGGYIVTS